MYKLKYSPAAQKDVQKILRSHLKDKCLSLLQLIEQDPYQTPPSYEKLVGDLAGCYSRRINIQHRLIYEVDEPQKIIKVLRMWTHYE